MTQPIVSRPATALPSFLQPAATSSVPATPAPSGATMGTDQLSLSSGTAAPAATLGAGTAMTDEQYAQFVADTIAMLDSPDERQRFQAVINMTKMRKEEALPLLQRALTNTSSQVVALAQKALSVLNGQAATPAPATPATPATTPPATPAATTPETPATPADPATPTIPTTPAVTPSAAQSSQSFESLRDILTFHVPSTTEERVQAAFGLNALMSTDKREDAIKLLIGTLDENNIWASSSNDVIKAVVATLASNKVREARPYIQKLVDDPYQDPEVKQAARLALDQTI